MEKIWDCVIVGGGAAGLSAALVLGRARRHVLVIDAGRPSNAPARGIGGLLGHDGRPPADLYAAGRAEVAVYPTVEVRTGEVASITQAADGFEVTTGDGYRETTRRILLAHGMDYRYPPVPGAASLWGRSVFQCPFCHGWEVRDRPLAVLANGPRAVHSALLLRGWSDDIVLLTDGPADIDADGRALFDNVGIRIDERRVTELDSADGELAAVVFADGDRLLRRGLLVAATMHQRSTLAEDLGVRFRPPGPIGDEFIDVDEMGQTSVPGVFAAGDVSAQMPQVAAAVAAGSRTAAAITASLLMDAAAIPSSPRKEHERV